MSELLHLTERAVLNSARHANPDLSAWVQAIDPVLDAIGQCTIGSHKVEEVSIGGDSLSIRTAYAIGNYETADQIYVPMSVIEANDPLMEAKIYRLNELLKDDLELLEEGKELVRQRTERVLDLSKQLTDLGAASPLGIEFEQSDSEDLESSMTMSHSTAAAVITLNALLTEVKKGSSANLGKIAERAEWAKTVLLDSKHAPNKT